MKHFSSLEDLLALAGQEVAVSDWVTVSQDRIRQFADATDDHQWIHVDEARGRSGPFGSTIAHGFLTLSLVPRFFELCLGIGDLRLTVNYGLNRVRFPAPLPAGQRVRGRLFLKQTEPVAGGGVHAVWDVTVEHEGSHKPVCVAEMLVRYYR